MNSIQNDRRQIKNSVYSEDQSKEHSRVIDTVEPFFPSKTVSLNSSKKWLVWFFFFLFFYLNLRMLNDIKHSFIHSFSAPLNSSIRGRGDFAS